MARNRLFGLTSRVLMLIVAGLLILSYASIVVNPAKVWLISLVGIFFVPLSALNLFLLLWALKRRSKAFLIPLMALLPSFFFVGRYVQVDTESEREERLAAAGADQVKVISYNVGRFSLDEDEALSRHACADSVFSFIMSQDADIICLQEFHAEDMNDVKSYLAGQLKDYSAEYYMFPTEKGGFGNVTLSRIPSSGKGVLKFDESANLALYTDYVHGDRRFRVYNCHFESYNISVSGLMRALSSKEEGVFAKAGNKMKRSITRRPKQVDRVFADIENCPVEAFVCGDFNDNPMSYTYYRMTRGRKDAFVEAGHGFGATFATLWPMLRIDYILYPERCRALRQDIPRIPFSDHYPVVAELEL